MQDLGNLLRDTLGVPVREVHTGTLTLCAILDTEDAENYPHLLRAMAKRVMEYMHDMAISPTEVYNAHITTRPTDDPKHASVVATVCGFGEDTTWDYATRRSFDAVRVLVIEEVLWIPREKVI